MEDPSLLEESSTLIDPNDPHRGAPLRLGSASFVVFFLNDKEVIIYLDVLSDRYNNEPVLQIKAQVFELRWPTNMIILWRPSHKYSI